MGNYNYNYETAEKTNTLTASTCHVQIYMVEEDQDRGTVKIHYDVLKSSDPSNIGKRGSNTLFAVKKDGTSSPMFHRTLKEITIATGVATNEIFEQYKAAKQPVPIEVQDWVGLQMVITLAEQKTNPQFTNITSYINVHDTKVNPNVIEKSYMEKIDAEQNQGLKPTLLMVHNDSYING